MCVCVRVHVFVVLFLSGRGYLSCEVIVILIFVCLEWEFLFFVFVGGCRKGVPTLYGRGGGCQGRGFPHYMVEVGVVKGGGSHIIW